jgi:hypothetical protein
MHRERVVMSCHAVVEYAKFEIDCIFFFFKNDKIIFPGFVPKLCLFLTPSPLIYVCAACVCLLAFVADYWIGSSLDYLWNFLVVWASCCNNFIASNKQTNKRNRQTNEINWVFL